MYFTAFVVSLAALAQAPAAPPDPVAVAPAESGTTFRAGIEASFMSFPSGPLGGSQDLFGVATPVLAIDAGEDFGFELGASLRLRIFDDPPAQRAQDFGGVLRFEDWDERSDFGQLLRELRIGEEDGGFVLRAGALPLETMGAGHLISRYSNRTNPNYHPGGARLRFFIGPTRTELFASDVLGARIFAADVAVDLGKVLTEELAETHDRYHATVSVAHDHAKAGGEAPRATLLHLDFDAAVYKSEGAQVFAVAGVGTRMLVGSPDLGASVGVVAEGQPTGYQIGGRLEVRKVGGTFRQGFFGPAYELARFAGVGVTSAPLADEVLPDAWTGFGEFSLAHGLDESAPEALRLVTTIALEQFSFGRLDGDAAFSLHALEGKLVTSARVIATGINFSPRMLFSLEGRYRVLPALYALAYGGVTYFPIEPGVLSRGIFAGVGAGVDFER